MEQDNLDNGIVVYCTKGNVMFNSSGEKGFEKSADRQASNLSLQCHS